MNKIAIIGCGGAGKSVLSVTLGNLLSLPVHHLDRMYWKPGWLPGEDDEFINKQEDIVAGDQWIIDGNYGTTMDIRLENADTIIFLDLSLTVCLWGVTKRYFKYRNTTRPDMTEGNNEQVSLEFLNFVRTYRARQRPVLMEKLAAMSKSRKVIIIKNRREIRRFLNDISNRKTGDSIPIK